MSDPQHADVAPAPSRPGPAPGRVHVAMLLLAAVAVLEVVGFAVARRSQDSALAEYIPPEFPTDLTGPLETQLTVFTVGAAVLWLVVWAPFLLLAWRGRPWARIAVTGLAAGTAAGVLSLSPNLTAVTVLQVVLSGVALFLLWWGPATPWYRSRNARRTH